MRQQIIRITTHDTKKTYEFGHGVDATDRPRIWEATLNIRRVDETGRTDQYGNDATIYIERETLERAGLVPGPRAPMPAPVPVETAEDLLLRLLEVVGFYPEG